ncbi:chaplin [Kitasatospora sp. NPDC088346]|uniref:chaplin n=1 Tax=Kitasatospora sp. NPDC088346 TaxID=3364073 RepID=UPI003823F39A
MRQVAKKGLLTAVATGSVLASTAGYAYAAGSEAQGGAANSPGVASGNSVQVPVDIPVNACGNTVDVVGLLNPAFGNQCGNATHSRSAHQPTRAGGASASGTTANSPGVGSGNAVQAPIHVPVDACGNSVNVVGIGNPAFGNDCANHSHPAPVHPTPSTPPADEDCPDTPGQHSPPPTHAPPTQTPPTQTPPTGTTPPAGTDRTGVPGGNQNGPGTTPVVDTTAQAAPQHQLASTGAAGVELLAGTGALLLIGGGVLYRRARAAA